MADEPVSTATAADAARELDAEISATTRAHTELRNAAADVVAKYDATGRRVLLEPEIERLRELLAVSE